MNREALHESLSAVMDNEADALELRRILSDEDPALKATWGRYQIARAAMHRELMDPGLNLLSGINARLEAESRAAEVPASTTAKARHLWSGAGRLAVAASVTLAVLAGVRFYNQSADQGMSMASRTPAPATSVTAPAGTLVGGHNEHRPALQTVSDTQDKGWQEPRVQPAVQSVPARPIGQ